MGPRSRGVRGAYASSGHFRINVFSAPGLQAQDILSQCDNVTNQGIRSHFHDFVLDGIGSWKILVPHTVYPPRADTELMCRAVANLRRSDGLALEIGCGSGAVTLVLASLGWNVLACDVNPFAVAATRGNLEEHGLQENVEVVETGINDGLEIPDNTTLIVWNLPYLEPEVTKGRLDSIEEASFTDIGGGWSELLMELLTRDNDAMNDDCLVLLLFRTDPKSPSSPFSWKRSGWSARSVASLRLGGERLQVFALWKPGQGIGPRELERCDSTMDEAVSIGGDGWQRVFAHEQARGRGRRGSEWKSRRGDVSATWSLSPEVAGKFSPGLLQTSIGAIVSNALGAEVKWPNDIMSDDIRKMGGILVESSGSENIRVGVGVNGRDFEEEGINASGWSNTLGEMSGVEVFQTIDASISTHFEDTGWLPMPTVDELLDISWRGISRQLSRGVSIKLGGTNLRPVGISTSGGLEALGRESSRIVDDLDGLEWLF